MRSNLMWGFLVFLGILIVLTGCALMALGVAILTTFGNTLITTGAVAASGGFVITAMGLVLRQIERLTDRIDEGLANIAQRPAEEAPAAIAPPAGRGRGPQLAIEDLVADTPSAPALPEPAAERPAPRPRPAPAAPPAADPMIEARRQRLEAESAAAPEPVLPSPEIADDRPLERPVDPPPRGGGRSAPPPPPLDLRPRPRTGYEPPPRARPAPRLDSPAPDLPPPAAPRLGAPQPADDDGEPTILKSGIIAGMAYTLYSDGSIQAELPSGVVRFASLHELRDHVARTHRSGE